MAGEVLQVLSKLDSGGAEKLVISWNSQKIYGAPFTFMLDTPQSYSGHYDGVISNQGSNVYRVSKFKGYNLINYLIDWIKFFNSDVGKNIKIVHGHVGSSAIIYLTVARLYGKKTIAHSHNIYSPSINLKEIAYRILSFPVRFIADKFVGPSKMALQSRFGFKTAQNELKSKVLYNAFQIDDFIYSSNCRVSVREEFGLTEDTILVGTVGRLVTQKNHVKFLNILSGLQKKYHDKKIVGIIVGSGPLETNLKKYANELNANVIFQRSVHNIQDYYSAFDIFLLTSYMEGLGNVLIEAQMSGLQVISTNRIPLEAHISENLKELSIQYSDEVWIKHISSIISNLESFKKSRFEESHKVIINNEQYDIERAATTLTNFYQDLLK